MIFSARCTAVGFASIGILTTTTLAGGTPLQGGDNAASAVPIPLNVLVTGTTVGYTDDSDEVCPYTGSTAPDVYYAYTEPGDFVLNVSLCESGYDTKVYVYDGNLDLVPRAGFGDPACNDDACTSADGGAFRSLLGCIPPPQDVAGGILYIVVDGWGGNAGDYSIVVTKGDPADCIPEVCLVECPPGAEPEPDDCLFGDPAPNDTINGGCNSTPNSFTSIECDQTFCGTTYFDGTFRDTDWFELAWSGSPTCGVTFDIQGIAEFNAVYGRIENQGGAIGCGGILDFAEVGVFEMCTPISIATARVLNGTYWFFVGADFSEVVDCHQPAGGPPDEVGARFILSVACNQNSCGGCPWDFDGDFIVGFSDLLKILSFWGPCPGGPCPWDLNGDSIVGFSDLLQILSFWGPCPGS